MIIFLYGPDTYRSQKKLAELKAKFISDIDPDANSLIMLPGNGLSLKELNEKISTGSLFVKKRMIIIEGIFKNKNDAWLGELPAYLKKFSETDEPIIIFKEEESRPSKAGAKKLFAFLAKQKFVQEFQALSSGQLLAFVRDEARKHKKEIAASTAAKLLSLCNNDLWQIDRELKKLSAYSGERKEISAQDIDEMVTGQTSEDIFALTDAISLKNKKMAAKLLAAQYAAGLNEEYILTMLIRQFKILAQIKDWGMSPAGAGDAPKMHPFVMKKAATQAKNFSLTEIIESYNKLLAIDYRDKTGQADARTEIDLWLAEL